MKNYLKIITNITTDRLLSIMPIERFDFYSTGAYRRAKKLGFGEQTRVYVTAIIYGHHKVGRNVFIGPYAIIDGTGPLTIGDDTHVSLHAMIWTHTTYPLALGGDTINEKIKIEEVVIENNVFIGAGTIILPGAQIGHHSIVAAGAIVTSNIPPYSLAEGVPAKVTGNVKIHDGEVVIERG